VGMDDQLARHQEVDVAAQRRLARAGRRRR
jgi:hypothetical protein